MNFVLFEFTEVHRFFFEGFRSASSFGLCRGVPAIRLNSRACHNVTVLLFCQLFHHMKLFVEIRLHFLFSCDCFVLYLIKLLRVNRERTLFITIVARLNYDRPL